MDVDDDQAPVEHHLASSQTLPLRMAASIPPKPALPATENVAPDEDRLSPLDPAVIPPRTPAQLWSPDKNDNLPGSGRGSTNDEAEISLPVLVQEDINVATLHNGITPINTATIAHASDSTAVVVSELSEARLPIPGPSLATESSPQITAEEPQPSTLGSDTTDNPMAQSADYILTSIAEVDTSEDTYVGDRDLDTMLCLSSEISLAVGLPVARHQPGLFESRKCIVCKTPTSNGCPHCRGSFCSTTCLQKEEKFHRSICVNLSVVNASLRIENTGMVRCLIFWHDSFFTDMSWAAKQNDDGTYLDNATIAQIAQGHTWHRDWESLAAQPHSGIFTSEVSFQSRPAPFATMGDCLGAARMTDGTWLMLLEFNTLRSNVEEAKVTANRAIAPLFDGRLFSGGWLTARSKIWYGDIAAVVVSPTKRSNDNGVFDMSDMDHDTPNLSAVPERDVIASHMTKALGRDNILAAQALLDSRDFTLSPITLNDAHNCMRIIVNSYENPCVPAEQAGNYPHPLVPALLLTNGYTRAAIKSRYAHLQSNPQRWPNHASDNVHIPYRLRIREFRGVHCMMATATQEVSDHKPGVHSAYPCAYAFALGLKWYIRNIEPELISTPARPLPKIEKALRRHRLADNFVRRRLELANWHQYDDSNGGDGKSHPDLISFKEVFGPKGGWPILVLQADGAEVHPLHMLALHEYVKLHCVGNREFPKASDFEKF